MKCIINIQTKNEHKNNFNENHDMSFLYFDFASFYKA